MNTCRSLALLVALTMAPVDAARVKDLASVEGVRDNMLIGYGLVIGLRGTGDRQQTVFSVQTLANILERMGVNVSPGAVRVNNIAAVMVTATLLPYAEPGQRLDVTISSIGDASSLGGGTLLLTSLKAANGVVYAAAQGPLSTGGLAVGGPGASLQVNHPTVGRIAGGGIIERASPTPPPGPSALRLQLHRPDFQTAARLVEAVNKRFPGNVARAETASAVRIELPSEYWHKPVEFIAALEPVEVSTERAARVVLNERTGTVVIGKEVRIAPVAVLHGNLTVQIVTTLDVSQPAPLSPGQTVVTPQTTVTVKEEKARHLLLKEGVTVEELIKSLVGIGSTPRDVINILQTIAAAGAMDAEVEVI